MLPLLARARRRDRGDPGRRRRDRGGRRPPARPLPRRRDPRPGRRGAGHRALLRRHPRRRAGPARAGPRRAGLGARRGVLRHRPGPHPEQVRRLPGLVHPRRHLPRARPPLPRPGRPPLARGTRRRGRGRGRRHLARPGPGLGVRGQRGRGRCRRLRDGAVGAPRRAERLLADAEPHPAHRRRPRRPRQPERRAARRRAADLPAPGHHRRRRLRRPRRHPGRRARAAGLRPGAGRGHPARPALAWSAASASRGTGCARPPPRRENPDELTSAGGWPARPASSPRWSWSPPAAPAAAATTTATATAAGVHPPSASPTTPSRSAAPSR